MEYVNKRGIVCHGNGMGAAWNVWITLNPHTPCLPSNEYYIEQTTVYNSCYYGSLKYNKLYFQWCTSNLNHVYWYEVNKLKRK
jgi:hypothetical protein